MSPRITALLLATVLPLALSAETEEHIDQRFALPANGQLVVDVGSGTIDVTTHASDEVVVSVSRKVSCRRKSDEEPFLREHPVTITHAGNTLTLASPRQPNNTQGWSFFGWKFGTYRHTEARYTLTVPATFAARLHTASGGITVSDLTGPTRARTGGGTLRFFRLHGPLDAKTSGGAIRLEACDGELKINTDGGRIEVNGGSGALEGRTSGGAVTVENFRGPVHVGTGGGGITLKNVAGIINASTSGGPISAEFPQPLAGEAILRTSGGPVTVRVAASSAFDLAATTSGGSIHSELPVAVPGETQSGRLAGPVNGGGEPLVLHTGGGSIHVKKLRVPPAGMPCAKPQVPN